MFTPFTENTVYRGRYTVFGKTMAVKKVVNTAVNGKLLLAIGNPILKALPNILKDFHTG